MILHPVNCLHGTETVSYTHLDVYKRQQKSIIYKIYVIKPKFLIYLFKNTFIKKVLIYLFNK